MLIHVLPNLVGLFLPENKDIIHDLDELRIVAEEGIEVFIRRPDTDCCKIVLTLQLIVHFICIIPDTLWSGSRGG